MSSNLLPSAYRAHRLTETSDLKVAYWLTFYVRWTVENLALLDMAAAFDTVDHLTLLRRLEVSYGISGTVHDWFTYLSGHRQYVRNESTRSMNTAVLFGVPQGSVLGPILFQLYSAELLKL